MNTKTKKERSNMTTDAEKTIANAIGESIRDQKIVTLDWTQDLEDALTLEADDYVDANGTFEAWGEPANSWRVHLSVLGDIGRAR